MEIVYTILCTLLQCIGFFFGFNLGRYNNLFKEKPVKEKKVKMTKEEKEKISQLTKALTNLDNYDGTTKGQEEIV